MSVPIFLRDFIIRPMVLLRDDTEDLVHGISAVILIDHDHRTFAGVSISGHHGIETGVGTIVPES